VPPDFGSAFGLMYHRENKLAPMFAWGTRF
jgi:hypothetical protein